MIFNGFIKSSSGSGGLPHCVCFGLTRPFRFRGASPSKYQPRLVESANFCSTCSVLSIDPSGDQVLSDQQIGFFLLIHRLSIPQRQPSASDPVNGPHAGREKNRQRKRNAYQGNEQHAADHTPEERKPERPDLPAKVRLEVAASRFSSLYIVDDDGNDRRYAKHEGTDNSRGGCYADQQAQRVQGIDTMGNGDEARWRNSDGRFDAIGHERCSFSRITLRALTVSVYSIPRLRQKNR